MRTEIIKDVKGIEGKENQELKKRAKTLSRK